MATREYIGPDALSPDTAYLAASVTPAPVGLTSKQRRDLARASRPPYVPNVARLRPEVIAAEAMLNRAIADDRARKAGAEDAILAEAQAKIAGRRAHLAARAERSARTHFWRRPKSGDPVAATPVAPTRRPEPKPHKLDEAALDAAMAEADVELQKGNPE
jgi:hypothetical protein